MRQRPRALPLFSFYCHCSRNASRKQASRYRLQALLLAYLALVPAPTVTWSTETAPPQLKEVHQTVIPEHEHQQKHHLAQGQNPDLPPALQAAHQKAARTHNSASLALHNYSFEARHKNKDRLPQEHLSNEQLQQLRLIADMASQSAHLASSHLAGITPETPPQQAKLAIAQAHAYGQQTETAKQASDRFIPKALPTQPAAQENHSLQPAEQGSLPRNPQTTQAPGVLEPKAIN